MTLSRRSFVAASLAAAMASPIALGCSAVAETGPPKTKVYVMGVIHSNHRDSETYSLEVLKEAVRNAAPDVVIAEIPPDRIDQAKISFRETGKVDEPRTQVFPEYTDVVFPLSSEMGFEIVPGAGWTRKIARDRARALNRIENDPSRAEEWAMHRTAIREYSRKLEGRGDDPRFIHTLEFDHLVEASRTPYERYFDADLGAGGWTQINRAHTDLINAELDKISGKGLTALITFGTAHKYKILKSIEGRGDIELADTQKLFR